MLVIQPIEDFYDLNKRNLLSNILLQYYLIVFFNAIKACADWLDEVCLINPHLCYLCP